MAWSGNSLAQPVDDQRSEARSNWVTRSTALPLLAMAAGAVLVALAQQLAGLAGQINSNIEHVSSVPALRGSRAARLGLLMGCS